MEEVLNEQNSTDTNYERDSPSEITLITKYVSAETETKVRDIEDEMENNTANKNKERKEPAAESEGVGEKLSDDNKDYTDNDETYKNNLDIEAELSTFASSSSSSDAIFSSHCSSSSEPYPCHPAPPLEVKLFVSRIPRTFKDDDIKPIFAEFGKVQAVSVIRDKTGSTHKGSAFVRMACLAQADAAVRALNNQKVLNESLGPLQVKYATGEAEKLGIGDLGAEAGLDQAKLFIGSIPRNITEEEIKKYFSLYGQIDEVYIMKDSANGAGKGCAFVKYAYKEQALHAMKSVDKKHTFEGCTRHVEVRFASTRPQRKNAQQQASTSGGAPPAVPYMPPMLPPSALMGAPPPPMRAAYPVASAAPYGVPAAPSPYAPYGAPALYSNPAAPAPAPAPYTNPAASAPYATPAAPAPYATPATPAPYTTPVAPSLYATSAALSPYATPASPTPYTTPAALGSYAAHAASAPYANPNAPTPYATHDTLTPYATPAPYASPAAHAAYATSAAPATYATSAAPATYGTSAAPTTYATSAAPATYAVPASSALYATPATPIPYSASAPTAAYANNLYGVAAATYYAGMTAAATSYGATQYTTVSIAPAAPRQYVWKEYFTQQGRPYYYNEATNVTQWEKPPDFDQQTNVFTGAATAATTIPTLVNPTAAQYLQATTYFPSATAAVTARPTAGSSSFSSVSLDGGVQGPPGATIFIFHLPPEWTKSDLLAAFSTFGNVTNTYIATDKAADNKAKGYAFVSYDKVQSAAAAVYHMNGFVWGSKKLKVSIKKGDEYAVQHLLGSGVAGLLSATTGTVDSGTTTGVTSAVGAGASAGPAGIDTASGGYAMYNGSTDINNQMATVDPTSQYALQQAGLTQYSIQTAAAQQYGAYGLGRYTPY